MRVDEHLELRWENMLAGIHRQPAWLRRGPRELLEAAHDLLDGPAPPRIYLVGCGDSHYAGIAARHAFETWSGIQTEALPALEFSRYAVEHAPAGAWAVCVSNSGKVVRTVEAATAARARGLRAIGVTYDVESRLAGAADVTLAYRYDDPGFGPGTISYVASLGALYALAAHAAELSGRPASLDAVEAQADATAAAIELSGPLAERLGRETPLETKIDVVGGGPSLGTALFGRAKLIEAGRARGGAHELEEWAHEEFFCTGPGTTTIVVAPPGASHDRAAEQLSAVRATGATAVALCPADAPAAAAADHVLAVPAADELLSPLAYCVPLELFAYHFASSKDLVMLGFDEDWRRQLNFRQIFAE
jgi:glutamine---fructose-6-phosphate transaminase (isomerizing)